MASPAEPVLQQQHPRCLGLWPDKTDIPTMPLLSSISAQGAKHASYASASSYDNLLLSGPSSFSLSIILISPSSLDFLQCIYTFLKMCCPKTEHGQILIRADSSEIITSCLLMQDSCSYILPFWTEAANLLF